MSTSITHKGWIVTSGQGENWYISVPATNEMDTTGVQQRIEGIKRNADLHSEISRLFTAASGFTIHRAQPDNTNFICTFNIPTLSHS